MTMSLMKFCCYSIYLKNFEGSGVCGTWDINSGPHSVPGLQIVPKSPDKYNNVTDEILLLPPTYLAKFEGNGACQTWNTKSGP